MYGIRGCSLLCSVLFFVAFMPKKATDYFTQLDDGKYWCESCGKAFIHDYCGHHLKKKRHLEKYFEGRRYPVPEGRLVKPRLQEPTQPNVEPCSQQSFQQQPDKVGEQGQGCDHGRGIDEGTPLNDGGTPPTPDLEAAAEPDLAADASDTRKNQPHPPPPATLLSRLVTLTNVSDSVADEAHPDEIVTDTFQIPADLTTISCLFGSMLSLEDDEAAAPEHDPSGAQRCCEVCHSRLSMSVIPMSCAACR